MSFASPPRPYPPDRYTAADPVTTARWRPTDTDPDLRTGIGAVDYLATGDSTNGDYGLYRWNMGPDLSGPDPHFHRTMSESFYVLTGTVSLYDGIGWRDARAGDFLYVPEGGVHGFKNRSGQPASMLILFAPGAPRERYFEGLAELAQTGRRPTREELAEFYREHDNQWL